MRGSRVDSSRAGMTIRVFNQAVRFVGIDGLECEHDHDTRVHRGRHLAIPISAIVNAVTRTEPADFLPSASIGNLKRRAKIVDQIHQFFRDRDFFHVETPLLSTDTVVDRYLHPIKVQSAAVLGESILANSQAAPFWLQTSPEFGMKRLLAGGATSIYQICKAFRREECGSIHNLSLIHI